MKKTTWPVPPLAGERRDEAVAAIDYLIAELRRARQAAAQAVETLRGTPLEAFDEAVIGHLSHEAVELAEIRRRCATLADALQDFRRAARAVAPRIVTARNPRKIRREGATR